LSLRIKDQSENEIEIVKLSCLILNRPIMEKLNSDIKVIQTNNTDNADDKTIVNKFNDYLISINSSHFCADNLLTSEVQNVNCTLEIDYTNATCRVNNLCHSIRRSFSVKFLQSIYVTIENIIDSW
jgi:hypothetical protein